MSAPPDLALLEAQRIAIEHVLWAAGQRLSPRTVLLSVGIDWPLRSEPTWHDAARALAIAWRRLAWAVPQERRAA